MKVPTQSDVAKAAGVARSTVSFAFHERLSKQLNPANRQHILEVARQLGYRPHRNAQLLRGKKSGLIGIIKTTGMVQSAVERSFFASQAIQAAGYQLLVNELLWEETGERRAVDAMLDARVEGVLLAGLANPDEAVLTELQRLRAAKIPVVAMGGTPLPGVPLVASDYRQGMAALTNHLLALGYQKLTFVSVICPEEEHLPQHWGFAERIAGFREATAGLGPAQARVFYQPLTTDWRDGYAPGHAAMRSLIQSGDRPEVLVCSNDEMAIGAISACVAAGLRVPGDIAVTGFDNTTAGRYACPPLTTVEQPTEAVARKAVELLVKQVRGETISTSEALVKLPCQLVVRESCGTNKQKGNQS